MPTLSDVICKYFSFVIIQGLVFDSHRIFLLQPAIVMVIQTHVYIKRNLMKTTNQLIYMEGMRVVVNVKIADTTQRV